MYIYLSIYIYSASQESEKDHGLYRVGDPVFVHGLCSDLERGLHELREYFHLHAHARARPLIRLVSCGAEITDDVRAHHRLEPRISASPPDRIWDVTFAADPELQRTGTALRASSGCSGHCGAIQVHMARAGPMQALVKEIRGILSEDLVCPFFGRGAATQPAPVTYKFQCRSGRHRSVAVCELLAHALHTSGMSSVEVVHEDLPCYVRGRDQWRVRGSCGCPARCAFIRHDRRYEMDGYLREARSMVRNYWAEYKFNIQPDPRMGRGRVSRG
jgi:hypothetical protein